MRLTLTPVPGVPEIRLELAGPDAGLWDAGTAQAPPFWAFAWAGGQGLARFILDNPIVVRGKRVLDLGAGSGLVGIAAARAGAASVHAIDIDPDAVAAIGRNAAANAVEITASTADPLATTSDVPLHPPTSKIAGHPPTGEIAGHPAAISRIATGHPHAGVDVIVVGDMFYSARMAHRIMRFLRRTRAADPAIRVLVSDPNRGYLTPDRFDELAAYDVTVPERLEPGGTMRATIWQLRAPE